MKRTIIAFVALSVLILPAVTLAAPSEFVPLSPQFPLIDNGDIGSIGLGGLIGRFMAIAIVLSATLAVIMVAIGGFKYMTTDSVFQMGNAKEQISNAIVGLLIVLTAVLIMAEINPNILKFRLLNPSCYTNSPGPDCFAS